VITHLLDDRCQDRSLLEKGELGDQDLGDHRLRPLLYLNHAYCGRSERLYTWSRRWFRLPTNMRQSVRQQPTADATSNPTVTAQPTDNSTTLVTVAEAVELLGLSEDAIRARLRRGTLTRVDMPDGRVLVDLSSTDGQPTASKTTTDHQPTATDQPSDNSESLVKLLREQLEAEREANRENRRIIAILASRIPELEPAREASPEATGEPVAPSEHQGNGTGRTDEETSEKPSWFRRFLGLQ
jgi:hypothetical protein